MQRETFNRIIRLTLIIFTLETSFLFFHDAALADYCGASVGQAFGWEYCVKRASIPQVDWTRGCTPTSASMVLGYWDGSYNPWSEAPWGYGRLIDNWQELSEYVDNRTWTNNNVPNILDELRLAMNTDANGGTVASNIGPGIRHVTNTINGYCFSSDQCVNNASNDHCWGTITNEILTGRRPFIWSVGTTSGGHSLAAWGYTSQKYVLTFNTWNYGVDYWYYTKYDNGADTNYQYVDTIVPGCQQGSNRITVLQPHGGEILTGNQSFQIIWNQTGDNIAKVNLQWSVDGGVNFGWATNNIPSYYGQNAYWVTVPNVSNQRARIRVQGFDAYGNYIAGDSSGSTLGSSLYGCASLDSPWTWDYVGWTGCGNFAITETYVYYG